MPTKNINPPLGLVTTDKGEGSFSFETVIEELIIYRLTVLIAILANSIIHMASTARDTVPPVTVV